MASKDKVAAARAAAQAQVKARERRALVMWIVLGVVLAGLFAALVAYIVRQAQVGEIGAGGSSVPTVSTENGAIPVGQGGVAGQDLDSSRVRLDVYFDFMCPYCQMFEQSQSSMLDELQAQGVVDVYYHPLNFLDRFSRGTQYSLRSASAAALVAQEQPDKFVDYVRLLFANQPKENTAGLDDATLVALAKQAGVDDAVAERIPDHEYAGWVRQATERASQDGVSFTPEIAINGELQDVNADSSAVNWSVNGALREALLAAHNAA